MFFLYLILLFLLLLQQILDLHVPSTFRILRLLLLFLLLYRLSSLFILTLFHLIIKIYHEV